MLSRSSSNAGNQLRRSKSAQTVQRQSSASSLIDPVAAKQHAIVAATLAYERAHGKENVNKRLLEQPSELGRRRSHRTRRSEGQGSHFEANRTPLRQPSKRVFNTPHVTNNYSRSRRSTVSSATTAAQQENHATTSKVIQLVEPKAEENFVENSTPIVLHRIRKSKSMYTTTKKARGHSLDDISFAKAPAQPLPQSLDETVSSLEETDVTVTGRIIPVPPIPLSHRAIYEVDQRVAKARDHHLQEFQKQRIRHRASFMLTPFKRKSEKSETVPLSGSSKNGVTYDNVVSVPACTTQLEERKVSDESKKSISFTSKIRNVFRRSSAPPLRLPAQQVEASRRHFGDLLSSESTNSQARATFTGIVDYADPENATQPSYTSGAKSPTFGVFGRESPTLSDTTTTTRSRVTSWADSTLAGTTNSRDSNRLAIILESPPQSQPSSQPEWKYSSFGFFRRVRKKSISENIPDSTELGLSKCNENDPFHIQPEQPSQMSSRRASAVHDTLPSQRRRFSLNSSKGSNSTRPTIRAVESGSSRQVSAETSTSHNVSVSSNVIILPHEGVCRTKSPQGTSEEPEAVNASQQLESPIKLGKIRNNSEPTTPTAEQIASRFKKSDDRWKDPLEEDDRSLFYPHSPQRASLERNLLPDDDMTGSPNNADTEASSPENYFAAIREPPLWRSMGALSPSLYSQDTNTTPQRNTKGSTNSLNFVGRNDTGVAIITTSQPVLRYSVGSPKKPDQPVLAKTSRDWRDWLSNEVLDLGTPPPDDLKLNSEYVAQPTKSGHRREHAQIDEDDVTIGSGEDTTTVTIVLPSVEQQPSQPRKSSRFDPEGRASSRLPQRPKLVDRPSSRMNERFPYIDTGRAASRGSRNSSPTVETAKSKTAECIKSVDRNKENSSPSSTLTVPAIKHRPLRRPISTNSFHRSQSSLAHYTSNAPESEQGDRNTSRLATHTPRPAVKTPGPSPRRPASALDIRASVTRKAPTTVSGPNADTDPTLAAIFKGPYNDVSTSLRPLSIRKQSSFFGENASLKDQACMNDNSSYKENSSPARMIRDAAAVGNGTENSVPSTPTSGQRLAEQFLNARRLRAEVRVQSESPGPASASAGSPRFI